jgi:L-seryl-tRNA(Ser) seleniumtransferase
LTKFNKLGFDLVTFSGGKGLRAPASTGLLMGRRDLIEAAKRNAAPHDETIGRGMKLNKDELVGLLVAVESCLQDGANSVFALSEKTLQRMGEEIARLEGVRVEVFRPPVSYRWPHLRIQWDEAQRRLTADQAREQLLSGAPSIVTRTGPDPVMGLELSAWMLSSEEVPIVVRRVVEVLEGFEE